MIFGGDVKDLEELIGRKHICAWGTMVKGFDYKFVKYHLRGIYTIRRWVGTDVLKARTCWWYRLQVWLCNFFVDFHCFVSWELQEEFLKVFPDVMVLPKVYPAKARPYIPLFTVMVYMPKMDKWRPGVDKKWLYGYDIYERLRGKYPGWRWIVLDGSLQKDVVYELYHRVHVLFRPTRHDGHPRMVEEAKMLGVPVVWDVPMSHTKAERLLTTHYKTWKGEQDEK